MMRMVLEVVMVLALVGGLIFVMKVLPNENKLDKALSDKNKSDEDDVDKSMQPDSENK